VEFVDQSGSEQRLREHPAAGDQDRTGPFALECGDLRPGPSPLITVVFAQSDAPRLLETTTFSMVLIFSAIGPSRCGHAP
jgi:hypothetical protein